MSHVKDHCGTPKVTRAWRRLGNGAVWICTCGKVFRLVRVWGMDGGWWQWQEKGKG